MTVNRRQFLGSAVATLCAASVLPQAFADTAPGVAALAKSQLIYLTPVVSGGRESTCHGEVWFVQHEGELVVVTARDAWRAEAIRRGFSAAKIWIGEFGTWKNAGNAYRSAPYLELSGRLETDAAVHDTALGKFGAKYAGEWSSWGPRFTDGLADGSRVMLRYTIQD